MRTLKRGVGIRKFILLKLFLRVEYFCAREVSQCKYRKFINSKVDGKKIFREVSFFFRLKRLCNWSTFGWVSTILRLQKCVGLNVEEANSLPLNAPASYSPKNVW